MTPYYYHPWKVDLTTTETELWDEYTQQIQIKLAYAKEIDISFWESNPTFRQIVAKYPSLQELYIKRARLIKNAENKFSTALSIIESKYSPGQKWLIYCDGIGQLNVIQRALLEKDYDSYVFHSSMQGDRNETLKYFSRYGGILVSIRCLDEGVDIPSATHAIILASSKNPREYIQRRGRILRRSTGKMSAHLFDTIVVPNLNNVEDNTHISIVEAELSRAIKFGKWAENPSCINDLLIIAKENGIDYEANWKAGIEDGDETESE